MERESSREIITGVKDREDDVRAKLVMVEKKRTIPWFLENHKKVQIYS